MTNHIKFYKSKKKRMGSHSISDHSFEQQKGLCLDDTDCQNGGKCQFAEHGIQHKHCHCTDGFSGPRCDQHCPLKCQNGGYCTVTPTGGAQGLLVHGFDDYYNFDQDDFECKCNGHFGGTYCEVPYKVCGKAERCYNGGKCIFDQNDLKHKCQCSNGFGGDSCTTKVDNLTTDESSKSISTLLVLFLILGGLLMYLIKRKRTSDVSNVAVAIKKEAREKHMNEISFYNDMPSHGSYSDHVGKDVVVNII